MALNGKPSGEPCRLSRPKPLRKKITREEQVNARHRRAFTAALCLAAGLSVAADASAQEAKHYRFAHDQQLNSGYSVAYDLFSAKLKELSGGKMLVDQY